MNIDPNGAVVPTYTEAINEQGLTIRQEFAARAMQGLVSCLDPQLPVYCGQIAKEAVSLADALIEELNK